jgi:SAM-dependent methyltransferase
MNLAQAIKSQLGSIIMNNNSSDNESLNNALRLLSKWRSVLIQNTVLKYSGTIVSQGPLAGLDFIEKSAEGCHIAKLVGCYEQPLHPYIEELISKGYKTVVNIGCAEGYYAVGLARKMPDTESIACDTNPAAQQACRDLAKKNGVEDRIIVQGRFTHADFANLDSESALIFCDIEGGEDDLLDPIVAPKLLELDIIVESHECLVPGITERLIERFRSTHSISRVDDDGTRQLDNLPDWFYKLSHLDQLLTTWEWRSGPTPWLIMTPKEK